VHFVCEDGVGFGRVREVVASFVTKLLVDDTALSLEARLKPS